MQKFLIIALSTVVKIIPCNFMQVQKNILLNDASILANNLF